MKKLFAFILFLALLPAPAPAQTLEDFHWLAGHWVYERDDGITVEVNWAPAIGNTMVGSLQQRAGEDLMAYETMKLSETPEGISYTFDLFLRDEQFERPHSTNLNLTWMGNNKAEFEGGFFQDNSTIILTLELTPEGKLYSYFIFKGERGTSFLRYLGDSVPFVPEEGEMP